MPVNERGRPIRSQDLLRRFDEEARRLAGAEETIRRVREAVRQTQLAVQAAKQAKPKGRAAGEEEASMYLDPTTSTGAERVGPFLTATRVQQDDVRLGTPAGTGAIRALREGEVWASLGSENETFEARMDPARLMRYNELLVPHVAGTVTLHLHHDNGSQQYGPFEESRLFRLSTPAKFNGRLEIDSASSVTVSGEHVHALGGLEIRSSDWVNGWELTSSFTAPKAGTIELNELSAHPSGRSLSFSVESPGGASRTKSESVSDGEELVVRASGIDPTEAVSFVKLQYNYS